MADTVTSFKKEYQEKVSIIVPAYHEAANLPPLAKRIDSAFDDNAYELIFSVDTNADGSFEVVRRLEEQYPQVRGVLSRKKRGKTKAIIDAFYASNGEIVVIIDADLQYPPEEIPKLTEKMDRYDVVNGKRIERKDNIFRIFESKTYNLLTSTLFEGSFQDNDSGLKAFRRIVLKDIVPYLQERWHRYLLVLTAERGYHIKEVPVNHYPRKYGSSKFAMSPLKLFRGFLDLLSVKELTSSVYFKGYSDLKTLLEKVKRMHGRFENVKPITHRKEYVLPNPNSFSMLR